MGGEALQILAAGCATIDMPTAAFLVGAITVISLAICWNQYLEYKIRVAKIKGQCDEFGRSQKDST
jgi:hypothetical protein